MNDGRETPIAGNTAAGLEALRGAFENNFDAGIELGAAFAVVRGDEVLVDLHGGWRAPDLEVPWTADTLVNVYSTSKGVSALMLAELAGAGRLDFDARVTDYWPEFGAAGKGEVTVAHLLSHQAGLAGLPEPVTVEDLCEHGALAARLAAATPLWPPGTAVGYHPILWGTLAQELCLRASGETLGARLARRRAAALGADVHLGLADGDHGRCAQIVGPNRPWRDRPGVTDLPPVPAQTGPHERVAFANPVLRPFRDVCSAPFRRAELPAANVHATALGLARLYAGALAEDGPGLAAARRQCVGPEQPDRVLVGRTFRRSVAGFMLNHERCYGPSPEAFGHDGAGGSFAFADPEAGIAVAYVMNQMQVHREADRRGAALVEALYDAL
ncbi:MAG: serine hydrolase domain-containing protein [Pseudomonadales bacterium]|jgi:CubicO group peptidase (beta-lactamase class C family)|nr:serine hydrolase domain-containing protein [Pseudomonadales bacterium]